MMKERSKVLAFYHFTTKRRVHLRASNPVESAFAMAPHTVVQTKAPLSPP
jgi:putative transposase